MSLGGERSPLEGIVGVLRESPRPLTAEEIASDLAQNDTSVTRENALSVLRGPLQSFVSMDRGDRFSLLTDPTLARSGRALPTIGGGTQTADRLPSNLAPDFATKISAQLEEWKKDLINFGRNNKLLYFNTSRRTRLRLTEPGLTDLYEGLVLRDKTYSFAVPREGNMDLLELEAGGDDRSFTERRGDVVVDYAASSAKDVAALQRKLFRLRSDARSTLNEQGINTLHLSLGILEWAESVASEERVKSPLILIPVSLEREHNGPYQLGSFEGDVAINPTLLYRLKNDFEIDLPSFDPYDGFGETPDPLGYLDTV